MTEEKRSATEILLSIEGDVQVLSKRVQNLETLNKVLLNNFNQSIAEIAQRATAYQPQQPKPSQPQQIINKDNFDERLKTSKFIEAAAEHGVTVAESPPESELEVMIARPSQMLPDPSGEDLVEAPVRSTPVRGQRGPKTKTSKISVGQVLNRPDGKGLFMGSVEIMRDGVVVSQTRTNPKGRWLSALEPGDYQVRVVKRYPPDSGNELIDKTYQISIPPSDKPMELDPLTVGDDI